MDKLFLYEPDEMIKKIKVIEPEMREDSYGEITEGLDTTSRNALAYISEIFSYMKKKLEYRSVHSTCTDERVISYCFYWRIQLSPGF